MPLLRDPGRDRHGREPTYQAQGPRPLRHHRTRGAGRDEPLARLLVVRALGVAGLCPQGPRDAGDLCPLLDLRRRHPVTLFGAARDGLLRDPTRAGPRPARPRQDRDAAGRQDPLDPCFGSCRAVLRRCADPRLPLAAEVAYRRAFALGPDPASALSTRIPRRFPGRGLYRIARRRSDRGARLYGPDDRTRRALRHRRRPAGDPQYRHRGVGCDLQAYPAAGLDRRLQVSRA